MKEKKGESKIIMTLRLKKVLERRWNDEKLSSLKFNYFEVIHF